MNSEMSFNGNKRKLLGPERESLILRLLGTTGRSISELSVELGVSEATVRRDLQTLEVQGKVRRVHGGAVRVTFPKEEPIFTEKASLNLEEKEYIAKRGLSLVEDKDTIYLDSGSTLQIFARFLKDRNDLTIITNSIMAVAELMESRNRIILTGGEFRAISRSLIGPLSSPVLERLHINKAFLSTIGFNLKDGISTTDANEAYTKEKVMERADMVIVLVDSSKHGSSSFAVSGSLKDIDVVVSDYGMSEEFRRQLEEEGIKVIT